MSKIGDDWINKVREQMSKPKDEVITRQIIDENFLVVKFLGYKYNGWNSFGDNLQITKEIGWFYKNKFVGRSIHDVLYYKDIKKIKTIIKEIESKGYKFEHDYNTTLETMFKSKDNNDVYLARAMKNNIWNECVTFIKQYNAENFSRSSSGLAGREPNI